MSLATATGRTKRSYGPGRGGERLSNGQRLPAGAAAPAAAKAHKHLDTAFVVIILALLIYGAIMVFSASYPAALSKTGDSFHFIRKHILFAVAGVAVMFILSFVDYRVYRRFVFPIFGAGILLLILVMVPGIGTDLGTVARRWINLKFTTFQPSEFMKFAIIMMFAHLVALNYKRMGTFQYGVMPFAICLLVTAGLMMLEPHLSGTILIFAIGFVMMFVGGTKFRWFGVLAACAGGGIAMIVAVKGIEYITGRLSGWLHPFEDTQGQNWQTIQSLIAIGSGGIMGRGIGNSRQKYLYLPEPYNDFIFAIICEELGLIGALLVIVLFVLFALRGYSIAAKAPDKFGFMLGVGLTTQVVVQAILNIAVVTNTVPNTGISLPFFSYGGTALLMQLGEMGILLNISRNAVMEKM